jgi:hypothetical protein
LKKKKEKKPNDLFATLANITQKKPLPGGYSKKEANAYILMLWLSQANGLLPVINQVNQYTFKLPDELVYKSLYHLVPKGFRNFSWTKGRKLTEQEKLDIKELVDEYNISEREARISLGI